MNSILNERNLKEAHKEGIKNKDRVCFNCWNATLFVLGKTDELYWSEREEIEDFIFGETLEVLHLEVGDILVLFGYAEHDNWDNEYDEYGDLIEDYDDEEEHIIHTAVYTGNKIWFHKKGGDESEFVSEEAIRDVYCGDYERSEIRRITKSK